MAKSSSRSHPLFAVWANMVARCHMKSHRRYQDYGGRGIRVFKDWRPTNPKTTPSPFWRFVEYVEKTLGPRPLKMQLDRIKNDRGYQPGNIRWATQDQNIHNSRVSKLTVDQVRQIRQQHSSGRSVPHLARKFGQSQQRIRMIVKRQQWRSV